MRVIAGKARRLPLKTPEGFHTRPTTDRTKETLFNMINSYLLEADFLDLFAGSGAIGIEALSRGANYCAFVENEKSAFECIKSNLNFTKLENGEIFNFDYKEALRILELNGRVFDIIFMDPPYDCLLEKEVLMKLQNSSLIYCDTIIIIEASLETKFDYLEETRFRIYKQKEYKTNKHVFIEVRD